MGPAPTTQVAHVRAAPLDPSNPAPGHPPAVRAHASRTLRYSCPMTAGHRKPDHGGGRHSWRHRRLEPVNDHNLGMAFMAHLAAFKWQPNPARRCMRCSRLSARWQEWLLRAAWSGETSTIHADSIHYRNATIALRYDAIPTVQMPRGDGAVQTPAAFTSARSCAATGTVPAGDRWAGAQPERLLVALGVFQTMNWIATLSESVLLI